MKAEYWMMKLFRYGFILFLILTINFLIPRLMPGDPISNILGLDVSWVDPTMVESLKAQYGLDKDLWEQYLIYLGSIFTMDLGFSISMNAPVMELILGRIGISLVMLFPAVILGSLLSLNLGVHCGIHEGGWADRAITPMMALVYAMPAFLIAMLSLTIFGYHLGWFPMGQFYSGGDNGAPFILDVIYHLTLPISVMTLLVASSYFLVIRNAVLQIRSEYFINVKKAHGLPGGIIQNNHIMRNVLNQYLSMLALSMGGMISGALIIEVVFSIKGMGYLLYDAILSNDYPLMQGCFIFISFAVLIFNMIAEILYAIVDPRIADGGRR